MKVKRLFFALLVVLSLVAMSCSQHTCPAYAQDNNNTNTEEKA
jgi:hypothetical protein